MKITIMSGKQMNESWQPDSVVWPENSICVAAHDEHDCLKGRVGLIMLPHMEGFWVSHGQLGTGLAQEMESVLMQFLKERMGSTHALTFVKEKANGLAKTIEKGGWTDQHLKVYAKETGKCQ